jgi:integrase family protein with SAM-like domain
LALLYAKKASAFQRRVRADEATQSFARTRRSPRRTIEAVPTACETLLEKYRCYLREERGLAHGSVRNMLPFVDRFLAQKYPRDHFDFAALKAGDITSFIRKQATELGSVQAKHMVSSLRSFFRYLRIPARSTRISPAAFLAYRFIRFPRFRDFCHLVPLRKSCSGRLELPTDGAIARS